MSASKDHENLTGAYALDALSAEETREFEAQLSDTEQTRYEAVELRDTAVQLGLAVAPEDPPAALRASILDAIASTPQLPAPRPMDAPHRARRRRGRVLAGTLSAMVLAAAAVTAIIIGVSTQGISPEDVALASDVRQSTAPVDGGGTLAAKWSPSLDAATVSLEGVPKARTGSTYELWYVGADGARAAGLVADPGGWVLLDGEMTEGDTIAVTVEPAGGSDQPTSDPIAAVATA